MKTFKTTILTLSLLLVATLFVKADLPNKNAKKTVDYVINHYIQGITHGKISVFADLLDNDFKQLTTFNKKTVTVNKKQFIESLKFLKDIEQNCTSSFTIVEDNDGMIIYKIELQYPDFVKTNYLTLANVGDDWRITNITVAY